jgi:hypothetical protein
MVSLLNKKKKRRSSNLSINKEKNNKNRHKLAFKLYGEYSSDIRHGLQGIA